MKAILLLFACMGISQATDYVSSKFSQTYVENSKYKVNMDLEMDVTNNLVTLTLLGPSNKWYSVGFDSSSMDSTYCVVVDGSGDVSERYLTGYTAGNELDFTWAIESNTVKSGYRTVVLTREYDYEYSNDYYHQFATSYSKLKTIYAYGKGSSLSYHGDDKRGSQELKASRTAAQAILPNAEVKDLWGETDEEMIKEEYDTYLTTSSVLTWITCIVALCVMAYFGYKRWIANRYEPIPDNCQSNISMVRMGASAQQEELEAV